jgi:hypothetical protein
MKMEGKKCTNYYQRDAHYRHNHRRVLWVIFRGEPWDIRNFAG